jgi:hypothetical protein
MDVSESGDELCLCIVPVCNFPLINRCVNPHYSSDHCGLFLHFCLKSSETEETILSIRNYIVDVLQSVYPFERSFLVSFSSHLLDEIKKLPFPVNGPRIRVAVRIEWMSFAKLIMSFRKSIQYSIKVRINSIDCSVSCGL